MAETIVISIYSLDEAIAMLPTSGTIDVMHVVDGGFVGEKVSRLDVVAKLRTAVVISNAGEIAEGFGYGLVITDWAARRHYVGVPVPTSEEA